MILGILTFICALTISAIAIYYSVAGLAAIFAAAVIPIIIMGVSLEVGKLVTAVWLHRNWKRAVWWLKSYLAIAVLVLMFITSMGIFGFLSKAHIEQTSLSQEQVALIETLDDKETRAQAKIDRWRSELDRLMKGEDVRVDTLIEKEQEGLDKIYARIKGEKDAVRADAKFEIEQQQLRITQAQDRRDAEIAAAEKKFEGSLGGSKQYEEAVSKAKANELSVASRAQKEILAINNKLDEDLAKIDSKYASSIKEINDRIQDLRNQANNKTEDIDGRIDELEGLIEGQQTVIDDVREEKFGYEKEYRKLEAEVGPIKYIAEFIYGENADNDLLEEAVRWVIIIIIFVFDPLAVLLLIASQYSFEYYRNDRGGRLPPKSDPDPEPDPEPPYTDEEWNEAHRMNDEIDRAKKIAENIPPTLSKKKDNQYLLWSDIDPDVEQEKSVSEMLQEGFEYEKSLEANENQLELNYEEDNRTEIRENTEEGIQASSETQDEEGIQGSNEDDPTVVETEETVGDLDKWNNWVEAANKAAAENPEDDEEEEFLAGLTDEEREAITKWKAEDDKHSLKYTRKLHKLGKIEDWPWTKYLLPVADYEDNKYQIMPELENELRGKPQYTEVVEDQKKRTTVTNWIEKEGKTQVKKSIEKEE